MRERCRNVAKDTYRVLVHKKKKKKKKKKRKKKKEKKEIDARQRQWILTFARENLQCYVTVATGTHDSSTPCE